MSATGPGPSLERGPFPGRLTLELTSRCNYLCVMCPSRLRPDMPRGDMSPALFRRLVDQAAEHAPVALVPFFRGESLLRADLPDLLAYAKGRGMGPLQLASNASLLGPEMARRLLDCGLDFISFSLASEDAATYAEMCPGGDLARVEANVLGFLELRDKGGYPTEVQVTAVKTDKNKEGLPSFMAYWLERADRVRIYLQHSSDGRTGSLQGGTQGPRRPCHKVFEDMVVYHDGRVAACNHDWFRKPALGDARRRDLAAIWQGRAYERLRGQHTGGRPMTDPVCSHCDHWEIAYLDPPYIGELHFRHKEP